MESILKLPQFWGFMGALMVFIRYSMKINYLYKVRADREKADNQMKVITALNDLVENKLMPAIKNLDDLMNYKVLPAIEKHEKALSDAAVMYSNTAEMMGGLKKQYDNFETRMANVTAGAGLIVKRLEAIETEVIDMKNGNVFVRTKK